VNSGGIKIISIIFTFISASFASMSAIYVKQINQIIDYSYPPVFLGIIVAYFFGGYTIIVY